MPSFKGQVKCSIRVYTEIAWEYDISTTDQVVTCYIEALENAPYGTILEFDKRYIKRLDYEMWIDGIMQGDYTTTDSPETMDEASVLCRNGQWEDRELFFGDLKISENITGTVDQENRPEIYDNVGTIIIKVTRAKEAVLSEEAPESPVLFEEPKTIEGRVFNGKGATHRTHFSEPRVRNDPGYTTQPLDDQPFVTFKFIYRSKAALQSLKLMPDDAESESSGEESETDDGLDDLSHEEVLKMLRKMKKEKKKMEKNENMLVLKRDLDDVQVVDDTNKKQKVLDIVELSDSD